MKLSLRFLLAGFDDKDNGHIIIGGGGELPMSYDGLGFAAIGSGAHAALSSLAFHLERQHISSQTSEGQCLYVACSAKFMAESATNVGKTTCLVILQPREILPIFEAGKIRKIWDQEGAPRLPENLEQRIAPLVGKFKGPVKPSATQPLEDQR